MIKKFKLKDIQPNPFRMLENYPLDREKTARLKSSIESTGFWDNIVGRLVKSKPQIAFGHHRLDALRALFPPDHEVGIIIKPLTDAQMLQILVNENDADYGHDLLVLMEGVRATVQALAEGKISTEEMPVDEKARDDYIRYAPSFRVGESGTNLVPHPYTITSLGKFLNSMRTEDKPSQKLIAVVAALEILESKIANFTEKSIASLSPAEILKMTSDLRDRDDVRKKRLADGWASAAKEREKLLALQAAEKQRREEQKKAEEALLAKEHAAKKEENDRKLAEARAARELEAEREKIRQEQFKVKRAELDRKVSESKERISVIRVADPTQHFFKTVLYKLETITSERNAFREELKSLAKKELTPGNRELVRKGLLAASDWYSDQAGAFLPPSQSPRVGKGKAKAK